MSAIRGESRSVRTFVVTEGVGNEKVTKTVTEETITKPNGEKIVNRKEVTSTGKECPSGFLMSSQPTESSAPAVPPQTVEEFRNDCLNAHNSKRAIHGVPQLTLANDLCDYAQAWVDNLASSGTFQHSKCTLNGNTLGENIASGWSSSPSGADFTGSAVVEQWYSEIAKHNFSSDGATGSGHFTQVVWKGSRELGVGKAKDGKGKCIVVGSYRPAGNLIGSYGNNVFPPSK